MWGCLGLWEALMSALEITPWSVEMWPLLLGHPLCLGGLQGLLFLLVRRGGGKALQLIWKSPGIRWTIRGSR